ncbi:MAG: DUF3048 domain-containing protein [Clostridiales bacterium]|nr:DUF3048 domain-containing protein [Clostridiales bacterium]
MKIILSVIAVIIVLAIAFVTIVIANEGEDKAVDEYLASQPSPSPSVSPSPSPSEEPSPSPSVEPAYTGPVNPLTGLPADTEISNNRPFAIMINNIRVAQPQIGISKADIIYEILVEGGITRMMAVFQDVTGAGEIGSIRSARPYFVDIALGHDALYIHAGGSPDAYSKLASTDIFHLDGVNGRKQDIFFRDPARKATMGSVHSLVTTDELILKHVPTYNVALEHPSGYACNMTFSDSAAPAGSIAAQTITAHFSSSKTTTFTYSAESGTYDVSQYKAAYIDGNDQSKISVANVLILHTTINVISGDAEGRIDVDVTGSGTGAFFCGGKYEEITWSRKKSTDQFSFTLADGSELVFAKGKTYICIISNNDKIDIKE